MASHKIFTDKDGSVLEAYLNDSNLCYIGINDSDNGIYSLGCVALDSEDLSELISELQYIKRKLDSIEENG